MGFLLFARVVEICPKVRGDDATKLSSNAVLAALLVQTQMHCPGEAGAEYLPGLLVFDPDRRAPVELLGRT